SHLAPNSRTVFCAAGVSPRQDRTNPASMRTAIALVPFDNPSASRGPAARTAAGLMLVVPYSKHTGEASMRILWADRRLILVSALLTFGFGVQPAYCQTKTPSAPAPGGGNGGNVPSPGSPGAPSRGGGNVPNGTIPNNNGTFGNDTTNFPQRTIFLSGRVLFDDGTPPNNEIRIERVCGANPRFEAH